MGTAGGVHHPRMVAPCSPFGIGTARRVGHRCLEAGRDRRLLLKDRLPGRQELAERGEVLGREAYRRRPAAPSWNDGLVLPDVRHRDHSLRPIVAIEEGLFVERAPHATHQTLGQWSGDQKPAPPTKPPVSVKSLWSVLAPSTRPTWVIQKDAQSS